jgi:xanthine dehydrogenase accessory factor
LVGSRRKVLRILTRIRERQSRGAGAVRELDLTRLHAPIGLALNAQGPEEIALSIAAELVALRRGADVSHMRVLDDVRAVRALALIDRSAPLAPGGPKRAEGS